nr:hypothetical protein [Tanacetum cinerariifolium]
MAFSVNNELVSLVGRTLAHIGYNCPSKVLVISNPEPCNNQTIDELPQTLPNFHPTFHFEAESPFTLDSTPAYVDESPNVFNPPPQPPVYHCEFCGNDAYYGYYCTPQASFIYPEPCYNHDFNFPQDFQNVPQQYPFCDDCGQYIVNHPIFNAYNSYLDSQIQLNSTLAKIKDQMTSVTSLCEMACQVVQKKLEEKQLEEERAAKAKYWKLPVCYDNDDDEERSDSLADNIIFGLPSFSAITLDEPALSIEEPDNSLSMGDEHLDTISATESDEFLKFGVENLIPIPSESEGIPEHMCDVPSHDNSPPLDVSKDQFEDFFESNEEFSSIDDDSFSNDNIDYVEASPPDSELVSQSGSTTTSHDISLLEYKVFYDDPVKEISSGSPTTHSDSPLYDSFMFDLSINPFPPTDRSDSYEFTDELIPFISPPEYDCFLFKVEPNLRDFTKDVVEDISPTKEPQVLNALPTHPTLQLNMNIPGFMKTLANGFCTQVFIISSVLLGNHPRSENDPGRLVATPELLTTIVATSTTDAEYVAAASGCGQVLWIQNQLLDYGHHFIRDCFEKKLISVDHIHTDDNVVDLLTKPFDAGRFQYLVVEQAMRGSVKGIHIIYTTFFWSIARIETTDEGTKILATVDGKPRTISESSVRRDLKLKYEAGISSLPEAELFKNLTLMGTVPLFPTILVTMGEGSGTPTEPHHTPSLEAPQSPQHDLSSSIHPPVTTATIPTVIPTDIPQLRQYTRRTRIAQSSALPTVANEHASPLGDDSQGEACLSISGLETEQDRANIIKTSTLPHDSPPRVTSLAVDEGSMQHKLQELTDLCICLIKLLDDKDGGGDDPSGEDAIIKGRSLEIGEEAGIERSTDKRSNDTEEMVNVITSLDAASILTSGVQVSVPPAAEVATVSIPLAGEIHTVSVPTGSGVVPTASPIFTTATPYSRRKGKEKMVESETPKKKKLQE